jgi:hypothetical protein
MAERGGPVAADGQTGRQVTYVHIGGPKTGTTYLQTVLWNNRVALRADGVLVPGWDLSSHMHAALDLQGARFADYDDPAVPGAWDRLVEEIRSWNGTAVITQEVLSPAEPGQIERALSSLAFSEVHIIYTARDLVRQIPAVWQEDIKNRHTLTFAEFTATLRAQEEERHPLGSLFWRMQDASDVLSRWARDLPRDRVHLITVPRGEAPPELLWHRFCAVTGIVPDRYPTVAANANASLGVAEANLLRRLNLALGPEVSWPVFDRYVKGLLAVDLAARPNRHKIILSGADRRWTADRCKEIVETLRKREYDVVGDLDDLVADAESVPEPQVAPDDPPEDAMLEAAITSMTSLLRRMQVRSDEMDRLSGENTVLRAEGEALRREGQALRGERDALHAERETLHAERETLHAERDRLRQDVGELQEILRKPATKLFVRRLSEKNRAVLRLRIIYWNIVEGARRLRRRVAGRSGGDEPSTGTDGA